MKCLGRNWLPLVPLWNINVRRRKTSSSPKGGAHRGCAPRTERERERGGRREKMIHARTTSKHSFFLPLPFEKQIVNGVDWPLERAIKFHRKRKTLHGGTMGWGYSVIACLRRRTHGVTFQKRKVFEFRALFMQIVPSREKDLLILVNRHLGKKNRKRIEGITFPASVELKKWRKREREESVVEDKKKVVSMVLENISVPLWLTLYMYQE